MGLIAFGRVVGSRACGLSEWAAEVPGADPERPVCGAGLHPVRGSAPVVGAERPVCGAGMHPVRGFAPVVGAEPVESAHTAPAPGANPRSGCTGPAPEAHTASAPGANPQSGCTEAAPEPPSAPAPGANPQSGCTEAAPEPPSAPAPGANPHPGCTETHHRRAPSAPAQARDPYELHSVPAPRSRECRPSLGNGAQKRTPREAPWIATVQRNGCPQHAAATVLAMNSARLLLGSRDGA